MKIHIVQKGDTLWKIAKKYGVNFEEMKKMNSQLSNPDMIMPGMKVKVPTSGGTIKKEAPMGAHKPGTTINLGVKKEAPLAEHPFTKEKPVPMPIVEAPKKEMPIVKEKPIIKEQPIIKEVPKVPYIPKMPLQIVPEIDINNYYMMNMQHMTVQQPPLPPKPAQILPEVKVPIKEMPIKEAPMKEMPIKEIPMKEAPMKEMPMKEVPMKEMPMKEAPFPNQLPVQEAPVQIQQPPPQEYCVPITPVMPGPGFCPPFGGFPMMPMQPMQPMQPMMPMQPMQQYPQVQGAGFGQTPTPDMFPVNPGVTQAMTGAPMMPGQYFTDDESSSFMPQMPIMNPASNPGAVMGATQNPALQQQMGMPYMDPDYGQMPGGYGQAPVGYGQMPAGHGQAPEGYDQMPGGYGQAPEGYGQIPAGHGQAPKGYDQMPAGYGQAPVGYGQMPAGYGQAPEGYDQMPAGYGQAPVGYGQMPAGYGQAPFGYGQMPPVYGQAPAGYGQMPAGYPLESPEAFQPAQNPAEFGQQPQGLPGTTFGNPAMGNSYGVGAQYGQRPYGYPQMSGKPQQADMSAPVQGAQIPVKGTPQGLPVGTGARDDCGCGPTPTTMPQNFVPPTPLIYSAPYTGPVNAAHPPYMNPYGMGPSDINPYGMPGYNDESH
ncbi:MAG: SafA/ExsA family spore coat assembly protein [Bacillus sp. (in: Bacteria)]|nr:SafA/ExsA family spore coat assembly protein [Bacillus sp. (in: firmicutes)]